MKHKRKKLRASKYTNKRKYTNKTVTSSTTPQPVPHLSVLPSHVQIASELQKYTPPTNTSMACFNINLGLVSGIMHVYNLITEKMSQLSLHIDYVGFDFGTVYSSVCLWRDGKPLMVDMQGVTRVFSLVEASGRPKITFGRDTMLLCGKRAQNILFGPKLKIVEDQYEYSQNDYIKNNNYFLNQFFEFMKRPALKLKPGINSAVVCLPGCFRKTNVERLQWLLCSQFKSIKFVSDVAAIFMCYLYERGVDLGKVHDLPEEYLVVSFGGGFFTCGIVTLHDSIIRVGDNRSRKIGGELFVDIMKEIVLGKVRSRIGNVRANVNATGRFWQLCMQKMEIIGQVESVVFEDLNTVMDCDDEPVEVTCEEFTKRTQNLLAEVLGDIDQIMDGRQKTTPILISGGMSRYVPFRRWLDAKYSIQVVELFNMSTACAVGTAFAAGVLNSNNNLFKFHDISGFGL